MRNYQKVKWTQMLDKKFNKKGSFLFYRKIEISEARWTLKIAPKVQIFLNKFDKNGNNEKRNQKERND